MAEAWVHETIQLMRERALAVADRDGMSDGAGGHKIAPTATAQTVTLSPTCLTVTVESVDTDIRYDIGVGVTADANSRPLLTGNERTHTLPYPRDEAWIVSIITK
ncbi:MAG: hypothetical protein VX529_10940 [Pseudomonadota bacterium]|nr:hypothetical protein [Pseudomonadota bacterium]